MTNFHDNTRISDHLRCNRLYYYRHRRGWVPTKIAMPLVFGSCWHAGQDILWKAVKKGHDDDVVVSLAMDAFFELWSEKYNLPGFHDMTDDEVATVGIRNLDTATGMYEGYVKARRSLIESMELLHVERPFAVPLWPDDASTMYIGRLDKEVLWNGRVWAVEHKTTTEYKKDGYFKASFIDGFNPNRQIDGYLHALHMEHGDKAKGVLIDAALVHKTVHEGFRLIPIEKTVEASDEWLWETQEEISNVKQNRLREEALEGSNLPFMPAYPKNTQYCSHYSGCPYLDICKGAQNPMSIQEPPMGYKEEFWEPFDELGLKEVLTEEKK